MSMLSVAATQMACSWDLSANLENAEKLIREAAAGGAQVILIQELFETPYFCIEQDARHFELATTLEQNQSLKRFQALAEELDVVLPFSWFERANRAFYNSRTGPVTRKRIISIPGIPASRSGIPGMARLAPAFAGINGSPRRHAAWR
jgi:predicted amidohydrolase